jgi:hypothetical protein
MLLENIEGLKVKESVKIQCDKCGNIFIRTIKILKNSRKIHDGIDYCNKCSGIISAKKKPQCSRKFWENNDRKTAHSSSIKNSTKYKSAINERDFTGLNNPMYGKTHSESTKSKMTKSRTGKKQSNITIRKRILKNREHYKNRDKYSINKSIRTFLHKQLNWYYRVYKRDGFKCVKCNSTSNLDAHHIKPLSVIIKEIILETHVEFNSNFEKAEYLKTCEQIIDEDLKNGITLCRDCHKDIHYNWGSHKPIIYDK